MRIGIVEQEARLLGRLIQANDLALQAAEALRPEHFVERRHRAIFSAVTELASQGRVSPVEVAQHPAVAKAGLSFGDLSRLLEEPALEVEVPALLDYLRHHALRRRLKEAAAKLSSLCDADLDAEEFELQTASTATAILSELTREGPPVVRVGEALESLVAGFLSPERSRRTTIGFPRTLGHYFGGLRAGHLVVLMGRPSMGKTALALQWATSATKMGGAKAVYIASLEMEDQDLADRILLQEAGESLGSPEGLSEDARSRAIERLNPTLERLHPWPLYISRQRGLRAQDVAVIARRIAAEHGRLDLIVVDYLQLLRLNVRKGQTEAAAVGDACRELRNLAGDLGCPVVVLSQLNRGVEMRHNKRPVLSDLRDSGEIEEAADAVVSVYREDYYQTDLADGDPRRGKAEVAVLKYRYGPTPTTFVYRFLRDRQLFEEMDEREVEAYRQAVRRGMGFDEQPQRRTRKGAPGADGSVRGGVSSRAPVGGAMGRGEGRARED